MVEDRNEILCLCGKKKKIEVRREKFEVRKCESEI